MKARIQWLKDATFVGESGTGHSIVVDGPPEHGGRNVGMRPMELMLMGLGSCASFDVVDILRKSRQKVTQCVTEVTAERADAVPAVFTKIHLHFIVRGHDLKDGHIERAVALSAEKYCSASIMLERAGVAITHDYVIEAEDNG